MATELRRPAPPTGRGGSHAPTTVASRVFNAAANLLGVQTSRGRPEYRWTHTVDGAEADDAPAATDKQVNADARRFGSLAYYWIAADAATAITVKWWVRDEQNDRWIVARIDEDVAASTEMQVPEAAHRPMVPVVTSITGGGGVALYVAGE